MKKTNASLLVWLSSFAYLLFQTVLPAVLNGQTTQGGLTPVSSAPQMAQNDPNARGAERIPPGQELVNMDFPELTEIKDIIKAVSLWIGKNVIMDPKVKGKVQIISPRRVTKEEAYQAFLSALNILGFTTVETGKIIKILPVRTAVKGNLKTFMGSNWTPRTDEVITQIVPLRYIDAKSLDRALKKIVSTNSLIAYEPTNTLIITDSGYKVRRVLDIVQLLDVQTQQPKIEIVPIKFADSKSIAEKVKNLYQGGSSSSKSRSSSYLSYKILHDERTNSVIIFGPPRTIRDVKDLVKKFDVTLEDPSRQSTIHVRPLDYADAKKIAQTLSNLSSNGKSSTSTLRRIPARTTTTPKNTKANTSKTNAAPSSAELADGLKITADEASNSLLITGSRSAYDTVNAIIRKLDIRRSQVFVEADILDINVDNAFRFGTSIFGGYGNSDGSGTKYITAWEAQNMGPIVTAGALEDSGSQASAAENVAGAFANDLSIGVLSGQKISVPGLGEFTPGALIKLIKSDANTRVLSSPHVLTINNEEAEITVGQKVYYNTTEFNPATQTSAPKVEKEDVDLTLSIKPNISFSNYVTLNIQIQANSLAGSGAAGLPSVTKRNTKQIVTVKTGQTVVISGLVETRKIESFKKIPLLGDIPVIGWLFRNSSIQDVKSNLLIFLTPHVVHGANDLAAVYQAKLKDRDEFLENVYGKEALEDDFYKRLPSEQDGAYVPTEIDKAEESRRKRQRRQTLKDMGVDDSNSL